RKTRPPAAEARPSPTESQPAPNPPRPNKWFLATAMLLELTWIGALVVLAVTG
ncbi:hypothetical protein LCGC14_3005690, partial [marine sediment metagenome]